METFVKICKFASEETLAQIASHITELNKILDIRYMPIVGAPGMHCFTFLALHTMDQIVAEEIISRENAHQRARQIAEAYLKSQPSLPGEGGGAPRPASSTPAVPKGTPQPSQS